MLNADVIIVGAGMVGASCALNLAQNSELSIALLDHSQPVNAVDDIQQANVRVSALGQAAAQLLSDIGVWQSLQTQYRFPYQRMQVWDEMNDAELKFDAAEVGSQQLGYIVDNQALVHALQQAIDKQNNIQAYYAASLAELDQVENGVVLNLASGEQVQGSLLIAADGANSWIRQTLAIPVKEFEYQQQAIVAKIVTESSHQATAWQRYLSSGSVAVLPVFSDRESNTEKFNSEKNQNSQDKESGNQSSIVWSVETAEADKLMALPDAKFTRELQHALENRFGKIQLLSKRLSFPLRSNMASRYVDSRYENSAVVLIGDAAHRIHPMAGQGVNLGFKDVAVLCQEILPLFTDNDNIADYKQLRRYERSRKLDNQLTDQAMTMLYRLFGSQSPSLAMLRSLGMKSVNRSGMLKNYLARLAMGV